MQCMESNVSLPRQTYESILPYSIQKSYENCKYIMKTTSVPANA